MTLSTTKTQQLQSDYIQELIEFFVITFTRYERFDLNSILRSIAFPFVFVFVSYYELIDYLSEMNMDFDYKELSPIVHPLQTINEQMQSFTVKNIRKMQSFPKSYRKQDMINALLITN